MSAGTAFFTKIHPDAILPTYGTKESVGLDLYLVEDVRIAPGELVLARTGLVVKPPLGTYFELVLRSSVAIKNPGLVLANSIGIIDPDYSGPTDELKIALLDTRFVTEAFSGWKFYHFKKGDRIAQLILREAQRVRVKERKETSSTKRGGFGSTGD